jgi:U3 small nucleolar RNA-associated protein 4
MPSDEPPSTTSTGVAHRPSRRRKAVTTVIQVSQGPAASAVNDDAHQTSVLAQPTKRKLERSSRSSEDVTNEEESLEATIVSELETTPKKQRHGSKATRLESDKKSVTQDAARSEKKLLRLADKSFSGGSGDPEPSTRKSSPTDQANDRASDSHVKAESTVDVAVHRIRSLNYQPKPILCIVATSCSTSATSWMAVSRESGAVELQTVNPKLRTVAVVAGRSDTPMTALTWTTLPSSTSSDNARKVLVGANRSDLYVVDFWHTSTLVANAPVSGGGIFCLECLGNSDCFAVGCQDGSIRIFRIVASGDLGRDHPKYYQLQMVSTVQSAGAAILSLGHRPLRGAHKEDAGELAGTVLFAGVADGTIRRYDFLGSRVDPTKTSLSSSMWKSTLRMTVECYGRSIPTRVWALRAASDGTVVSGDSLGHVQFWDGDTGTLIRSFDQNDAKADVLALDMTADESKVFASGVDSRVVCIERSKTTTVNHEWVFTQAQRPHTHDVKAVAIVKRYKTWPTSQMSKETEILCTGGVDTKLCTYHVPEFGVRRPRALYPWPSLKSPVATACSGRILAMIREDRVDLYELAHAPERESISTPQLVSEKDTLMGTVKVTGYSNMMCCAISDSGEYLAISDIRALLLFRLKVRSAKDGSRRITAKQMTATLPGSSLVVAMHFIQDSSLVVATSHGRVHILSIVLTENVDGSERTVAEASTEQTLQLTALTVDKYAVLPVHSVFGTRDGVWFATFQCSSGSDGGKIEVFRRNAGTAASYHLWWTLPSSLGEAITAASFLESGETPIIAVASVNYALYLFDVSKKQLNHWSEKAGYPLTSKLPYELASRNDFPVRISTNPGSPSLVMMVSAFMIHELRGIYCRARPKSRCGLSPAPHCRLIPGFARPNVVKQVLLV